MVVESILAYMYELRSELGHGFGTNTEIYL